MFGVTVASYHKPVTAINVYFALKKKNTANKAVTGFKTLCFKIKTGH